jgi:DNA polymerase delta subunit 2
MEEEGTSLSSEGEWIALASGLEMGNSGVVGDLRTELLVEWLNGEAGNEEVSFSCTLALIKDTDSQ